MTSPLDSTAPASHDQPVPATAPANETLASGADSEHRHQCAQAYWQAVATHPFRYDLFAMLRRVDALHSDMPRLGRGKRPSHEPLRIGQDPSLAFAPSTIARLKLDGKTAAPKLEILSFGLFGANGPMPLVLTEQAHERAIHHGDRTLIEFADIFHHRLALLFYRAWADSQSSASLDRSDHNDAFSRYSASLISYGQSTLRGRDTIADHAKLNHAGHLVRQTRNAEGLQRILSAYFNATVAIEEFAGRWLALPAEQCTRLGPREGSQLGITAIAGRAVWDRQYFFRLRLGPLNLDAYTKLLPPGGHHQQLLDWVRAYIGIELDWDLRLVLAAAEVPRTQLGGNCQLGWTSWMAAGSQQRDRADLVLNPERIATRQSAASNRQAPLE